MEMNGMDAKKIAARDNLALATYNKKRAKAAFDVAFDNLEKAQKAYRDARELANSMLDGNGNLISAE